MPYNIPGVYINEGTYGASPQSLVSHDRVYLFGTSSATSAVAEREITSYDDFVNVYGLAPLASAVKAFFQQTPTQGLTFIRVVPIKRYPLTVPTVTVGNTYSLVVNGITYSYVAITGDNEAAILSALRNLFVSPDGYITQEDDNSWVLMTETTATGTGVTVGTSSTPVTVDVRDYAARMVTYFRNGRECGFILAPSAYAAATADEHSYLASIAEAVAVTSSCVSLVDPRTATNSISLAIAEAAAIGSPRGHSWYYFPYAKSLEVAIPPSVLVAAVSIKAQRISFSQPAAGKTFPLAGITGFTFDVQDAHQAILNPKGINVLRFLPRKGWVIYGARTLSTSAFYKFGTTRVIMNVLGETLRQAYDDMVLTGFSPGITMSAAKSTAANICNAMYAQGSLYGNTPDAAFRVVCDDTNNTAASIDSGVLNVNVLVKPTPTLEVVVINISRASLAADLTATSRTNIDTNRIDTTISEVQI